MRYEVEYAVRSGASREIVRIATVPIEAKGERDARERTAAWAHEHDGYCDPRIDPLVEILSLEAADEDGSGDPDDLD